MKGNAAALVLVLAACGDAIPPPGNPQVELVGDPTEISNDAFGYVYETRYSWPGDNAKGKFHLVTVHDCRMQYGEGSGLPIRAFFSFAEFWPLDRAGTMPSRLRDRISRLNQAGKRIVQAVECCRYTIHGVEATGPTPANPVRVPLRDAAGEPRTDRDGKWVYIEARTEVIRGGGPEPAGTPGYYRDGFRANPRPEQPLRIKAVAGRTTEWTTNYGYTLDPPGADKEVLVFGGALTHAPVGDPRVPHQCDF